MFPFAPEFVDKFSDTLKYIDCCYFNSNETLIDALVSCEKLIYIYMIGCPGEQRRKCKQKITKDN